MKCLLFRSHWCLESGCGYIQAIDIEIDAYLVKFTVKILMNSV